MGEIELAWVNLLTCEDDLLESHFKALIVFRCTTKEDIVLKVRDIGLRDIHIKKKEKRKKREEVNPISRLASWLVRP